MQPDQPPAFLDTDLAKNQMDELRTLIPVYDHDTEAEKQARRDSAVAAMVAMAPRDACEAMLACQAIMARHAADDCYYRARLPDTSPKMADSWCRLARSLMRTVAGAVRLLEERQARPLREMPKFAADLLAYAKTHIAARADTAKPPAPAPAPRRATAGRHPEYGYLH